MASDVVRACGVFGFLVFGFLAALVVMAIGNWFEVRRLERVRGPLSDPVSSEKHAD